MYRNEDRGIYKFPSLNLTFHLNKDGCLWKVECELPYLLFGHTGRLISSVQQLQAALQRLEWLIRFILDDKYLASLSAGYSVLNDMYFKRIDLVWQYDVAMPLLTPAMRLAKHKRIQSGATVYGSQNLTFPGKNLKAVFYDKQLKMKRKPGDVTRIEFKVEGKEYVADLFEVDKTKGLRSFDLQDLYNRYRVLVLGFVSTSPCTVPSGKSVEDFLAIAEKRHPGITELYFQVRRSKRQTQTKTKAKIRSRKMHTFNISDLVPAGHIPSIVEVQDPATEKAFDAMVKNAGLFQ